MRLPRFKMEFGTDMIPFLTKLGIEDLFGHANLRKITDERLYGLVHFLLQIRQDLTEIGLKLETVKERDMQTFQL